MIHYKEDFHKTSPISFTFFELVLFLILGILLNQIIFNIFPFQEYHYLIEGFVEIILGLIALILIFKLDLFEKRFFSTDNLFLGLKLGFFVFLSGFIQFLIYLYINSSNQFNILWIPLLSSIFYSFSVGFYEEVFMRGLLLGNLIKNYEKETNGMYKAVFISAIIFGLAHLVNLLHAPIFDTIIQVVYSISAGVLFGCVFVKTKNLLSIILLHSFFNLFTYIAINIYSISFISYNLINYPLIYISYNVFIIFGNFLFGLYVLKQ